ncbi:uncharacterized protein BO97DRAFT_426647, partial [Aspergillus homomorphus CBS 101889]
MHLSYILALLGATGITLGLPVSNDDQLESTSQEVDKRFYYITYAPEKRSEEAVDKRFYYTSYAPEKRDEEA